MSESLIRSMALQLSQLLQQHGAERYELEYTGSNDSTDGCTVQVFPESLTEQFANLQTSYQSSYEIWDPTTQSYSPKINLREGSFEDAAYNLAELLWNYADQGGWYNNDGGRGTLVILPGGFIEFEHVNYIESAELYDEDTNEWKEREDERAESIEADWRFNVFAGPINTPRESAETPA